MTEPGDVRELDKPGRGIVIGGRSPADPGCYSGRPPAAALKPVLLGSWSANRVHWYADTRDQVGLGDHEDVKVAIVTPDPGDREHVAGRGKRRRG